MQITMKYRVSAAILAFLLAAAAIAFFFHSFRVNRPYTGGCVAVPESVMKYVMTHIKPGCKFTIDSLENFKGDLDA